MEIISWRRHWKDIMYLHLRPLELKRLKINVIFQYFKGTFFPSSGDKNKNETGVLSLTGMKFELSCLYIFVSICFVVQHFLWITSIISIYRPCHFEQIHIRSICGTHTLNSNLNYFKTFKVWKVLRPWKQV